MRSRLRTWTLAIAAVVALMATTACGGSPTVPDGFDVPSLQTTDLLIGTGAEATVGRTVAVHYAGFIYNPSATANKGALFDSSAGRAPLSFTMGTAQVVPGFDQGIRGMKVGGKRNIVIPSALAYGSGGNPPIPPNSAIIFDVELVSVQ